MAGTFWMTGSHDERAPFHHSTCLHNSFVMTLMTTDDEP